MPPGDPLRPARPHTHTSRRGWLLLAVATVVWSGLCLRLAQDGRVPSGPTPLGPAHYRLQAGALFVLLPLASAVSDRVQHWRRTAAGRAAPKPPPSAVSVAVAALVLSVPEWLAYAAGGWTALQAVAPGTGLAALGTLVTLNVRGSGWASGNRRRAVGTGLLVTLVQGALLAPVLR